MMTECKHNYLPQVVMANNFEKTWAEYMEAYNSCHPERFLNGLQNEVNRRVEAAADYEQQ